MASEVEAFEVIHVEAESDRVAVTSLLSRLYRSKGYSPVGAPDASRDVTSFLALGSLGAIPLGTISVRCGAGGTLSVEELFHEEVRGLRARGRRPCEFTRFAIDTTVQSRELLLALFNAAFLHAYEARSASDLLIEVNPAHSRFYQRQFHFKEIGAERFNPCINAPSVLLWQDTEYLMNLAYRGGWRFSLAAQRSLLRCMASVPRPTYRSAMPIARSSPERASIN